MGLGQCAQCELPSYVTNSAPHSRIHIHTIHIYASSTSFLMLYHFLTISFLIECDGAVHCVALNVDLDVVMAGDRCVCVCICACTRQENLSPFCNFLTALPSPLPLLLVLLPLSISQIPFFTFPLLFLPPPPSPPRYPISRSPSLRQKQ